MTNSYKHIRPVSDLHINGFQGKPITEVASFFVPADQRDQDSILVLAGDITPVRNQLRDFIQVVSSRFAAVIYVPGNHEYYGSEMDEWNVSMNSILNNIHDVEASIDGAQLDEYYNDGKPIVRFISATLWADGGKSMEEHDAVANTVYDFMHIRKGLRTFTVGDMMTLHQSQKKQIEMYLDLPWKGKTVVVTHHVPSYSLCHPRFPAESNGGFASDSDDLILKYKPWMWIHGHTHDTIDTKIGDTRIVCNPRGYVREWNTQFNKFPQLFIDL